jgi:hypothetical protein
VPINARNRRTPLKAALSLLALLVGTAHASSDGELGWTNLSFCNGAGYCIDINTSSKGAELEQVRIRHKGVDIAVPDGLAKQEGSPPLNQTRFVNIFREDRRAENHLEIPLLRFRDDGSSSKSVLTIVVVDDKVTMTKVVASP